MLGLTTEIEPHSLESLSRKSLKRALDLFSPDHGQFAPPPDGDRTTFTGNKQIRLRHKIQVAFGGVEPSNKPPRRADHSNEHIAPSNALALPGLEGSTELQKGATENALVVGPTLPPTGLNNCGHAGKSTTIIPAFGSSSESNLSTSALMERIPSRWPCPEWHAPWKNYRVIQGHLGLVRSVAFDPSNEWFCTGSADRTIKIWDVATGVLKLTLTGHIGQVRGLAVSNRHTYMFSCADDKQVKCWDLEHNKNLACIGYPILSWSSAWRLLFSSSSNSGCFTNLRARLCLQGMGYPYEDANFCTLWTCQRCFFRFCPPTDPQVVTGSHDSTIKFWDLRYGRTMTTLTHHKHTVRAMAPHPKENAFVSASADNIKKFSLPRGEFCHNLLSQQKATVNAVAVNEDGVMITGGDRGGLWFWDWKSGHNFQQAETIVQPGSLESEAGIYAACYDKTGSRLVTCEADKTIKMWKEDENATPETHPLNFRPPKEIRRF